MTAKSQELQYIESNPKVCGGQWVFKGTRIMVWLSPLILLDENIPESRRLALFRWKPFQIGYDLWDKGVSDDQIAIRLRTLRQPTFATQDRDFFASRREFGHARLAIVFVDASGRRFVDLVDRFLRHRSFRTHAGRMGRVLGLNEQAVSIWRASDGLETEVSW